MKLMGIDVWAGRRGSVVGIGGAFLSNWRSTGQTTTPAREKRARRGAPGEGACPYTNYLGPLRSS
jgi:hypothetical protein